MDANIISVWKKQQAGVRLAISRFSTTSTLVSWREITKHYTGAENRRIAGLTPVFITDGRVSDAYSGSEARDFING